MGKGVFIKDISGKYVHHLHIQIFLQKLHPVPPLEDQKKASLSHRLK